MKLQRIPHIAILSAVFTVLTSSSVFCEFVVYKDSDGVIHLDNRPDNGVISYRRDNVSSRNPDYQRAEWNPPPVRKGPTNLFDDLIREESDRHGLDFGLLKAVIHAESGFNPNAVSHKGARGLMQLMPATAREVGVKNIFDPKQNIRGGARYLKWMMNRFDDDLKLSLAAYNAGPTTVDRMGGVPPYRETKNYVNRVLKLMRGYNSMASSGGRNLQGREKRDGSAYEPPASLENFIYAVLLS